MAMKCNIPWNKGLHGERYYKHFKNGSPRPPSMLGKYHREETKRKIGLANSISLKGNIPWNKSIHGDEFLKHFKNGHPFLGRHHTAESKRLISKNSTRGMLGKHLSEEAKRNLSLTKLGSKNPMFGKHHTSEEKLNLSKKMKTWYTTHKPPMFNKHHKKETIKRILRRRTPSGLEINMIETIKKYSLPYMFVGNGKFFIENYNPDFVNINGQKIVLEVYAKYFKGLHGSIDSWKQKRRRAYGKYGYRVLFFNEAQTNENFIFKKLSSLSNF